MAINVRYFNSFNGGLKCVQLGYSIIIIILLASRRIRFVAVPLITTSIGSLVLTSIFLIIRIINVERLNGPLHKLEFGYSVVWSALFLTFSNALIAGFHVRSQIMIASIVGWLAAAAYACDAIDKLVFYLTNDAKKPIQLQQNLPSIGSHYQQPSIPYEKC